jgi:drug/metabolite transporter (DMT)-like permease
VCFFTAIAAMPIADAIALVFIYPFIVTALSPVVLGESVGVWRWSAVIVGFAGAMVIIQPGFREISPAMLWAAGCGTCYACYVLMTRRMAGSDRPAVTLLMTGLVGTVMSTAILPLHWMMPTVPDFALMASLGAMAALGHYLIIVAHERASAPQLAPYGYVEIVSATVVGFVMFGDVPALATWAGMAIIVASGIVIAWREARLQRLARAGISA